MNEIKVLHLITRLILGGAQENTILTVQGLKKKEAYEVDLVTGPPLGPEGSLVEEAAARGVHPVIIPQLRREINPWRDFISFIILYRLIKRGNYDIVHTHSSKAGILGRLAAKLAGTKIIVHTIHGLPFHKYQSKIVNCFYIFCEKLAASCCTDKIITVAEEMARKVLAAKVVSENKLVTIYSGMELDKFLRPGNNIVRLKEKFKIAPELTVVGKIARLFPLKGHEYLLEAAAEVIRVHPQVKFLLVGDGILKGSLEAQAERLGIRNKVIFAGLIPRDEIPELLSIMDIIVHTSLREGLARVLPQALAGGKPVVAFNIDGASEVVREGVTGHLVTPEDSGKLAQAILDLINNKEKAVKMGEEGRKIVDPAFRAETMVDKIAQTYEELIFVKEGELR